MTPSLQIATDNVYKFLCLFGLALIVMSIVAFISTYTASLDTKIKYIEVIISLEANAQRTKADEDRLDLNRKLLEIAKSNESFANNMIISAMMVGAALSWFGFQLWYECIQKRDDAVALLQREKLELEIAKLRDDLAGSPGGTMPSKKEPFDGSQVSQSK